MRLFLLPISTHRSLIYCQKRVSEVPREIIWWKNPVQKATTKGSETWLSWEKNKQGWKKQVTTYGNKLFQRLPFEEWGLKSIPPLTAKRKVEELQGKVTSQLEYPGNLLRRDAAQNALEDYGSDDRQSFHSKWLWGSVLGMPISAPFMLVPVVPNLPFFYLVFRAWSHWKARQGSEHIEFLVKNQLFEKRPSSVLAKAYDVAGIGIAVKHLRKDLEGPTVKKQVADEAIEQPQNSPEQMLLSKSDGIFIADCLDIPELAPEIERAVWQIERSIKSKKELGEEKRGLDSATKSQSGSEQ